MRAPIPVPHATSSTRSPDWGDACRSRTSAQLTLEVVEVKPHVFPCDEAIPQGEDVQEPEVRFATPAVEFEGLPVDYVLNPDRLVDEEECKMLRRMLIPIPPQISVNRIPVMTVVYAGSKRE